MDGLCAPMGACTIDNSLEREGRGRPKRTRALPLAGLALRPGLACITTACPLSAPGPPGGVDVDLHLFSAKNRPAQPASVPAGLDVLSFDHRLF